MRKAALTPLPIDEVLPRLKTTLASSPTVVLSAPAGAGKTTRVPVALISSSWLGGKKIVMLEPRRLAARRAAEYIAAQLGERMGETVGYRIRGDLQIGPRTRIEVVTEGILTRMLQSDPELPGVGIVIFDEFHERSIHADAGLALALDVQSNLRSDLRIVIMSATLDGLALAGVLGDAPVIEGEGRAFPVVTHYARFPSDKAIELRVVDAVIRALHEEEGDVLVFLPGRREIRRVEEGLWERRLPEDVVVYTLHGEAPYASQAAALAPLPGGKRKVILSTNVAETSLTIEGICVVIDSGLVRVPRFDPRRGMTGLVTVPVSRASAEQRRGRAGRVRPGSCYRLWTEEEHEQRPEFAQPEIKSADLAPLALELALWGSPMGEGLKFLDPPPRAHLQQARSLLTDLGALDAAGVLTPRGREMAELPVHPRLSAMILRAKELGLGALACDLAALLEERDLLAGERDVDVDLTSRWHVLKSGHGAAPERIVEQSRRLRQLIRVSDGRSDERMLGLLLAMAYPERVAERRGPEGNRYTMVSGTIAVLPAASRLARERYLAVGEVDGVGAEVRIYLAAPLGAEEIRRAFSERLVTAEEVFWNAKERAVVARRVERLGSIVLAERPIEDDEQIPRALAEGVKQAGLESLPWTAEARSLQERNEWVRRYVSGGGWPDLSSETLFSTLDEWLLPFLGGMRRLDQLSSLDLASILRSRFSHEKLRELDRLAPSHLVLPSGSRVLLDYAAGPQPVLAVQLQELFGMVDVPRVAAGRVAVLVQLLSPARRPLAVTQDLRSFWTNVYPAIRTQMRARYPKHFWPEEPLSARPTNRSGRK